MTAENPQSAQPEDAQQPLPGSPVTQAIWDLPVESEERRKLAETMQSLPAEPAGEHQAAEELLTVDPATQAIGTLPVESEERRKLAESAQSLRFQHDAPDPEAG